MVGPFSVFLSVPSHGGGGGGGGSHDTMEMMYSSSNYGSSYSYSSPPSSSVDCTLSLGTPSTRSTTQLDDVHHRGGGAGRRPAASYVSNFCWDLLHTKQKSAARGGGNANSAAVGASAGCGDPLLARRCANCDTTSTPLWRNGPKGPKVHFNFTLRLKIQPLFSIER